MCPRLDMVRRSCSSVLCSERRLVLEWVPDHALSPSRFEASFTDPNMVALGIITSAAACFMIGWEPWVYCLAQPLLQRALIGGLAHRRTRRLIRQLCRVAFSLFFQ